MTGATAIFLFTDLVGSTEMLDKLGDDGAELLRRTHFGLLRDAVTLHGGEEVKNLGDGLMVAFDTATNAIRCAISMQEGAHHHNAIPHAEPLEVRIGLHAGEAIRDEGDYFGSAVVAAKRLCDRANGDQIIVSELVRGLVGSRGDFTFADLGLLELKGFKEPMHAYQVETEMADVRPLGLPAALARQDATHYVGREQEFAQLTAAWDEAKQGNCRLAFVVGEAGIGKSRFVSEFVRRIHHEGAMALFGHCDEDGFIPYQPLADAMGHYVASCTPLELRVRLGPAAAELARLIPDIAQRLPSVSPSAERVEPEEARYKMYSAAATLLTDAVQRQPVVVVLDDLHWTDKSTLSLLTFLCRELANEPILFVGTYRDLEVGPRHPLSETMAVLQQAAAVRKISLSGLTESDVVAFMTTTANQVLDANGLELARVLWHDTEGNPFFIAEILRHLIETSSLIERDARWTSDNPSIQAFDIPQTVKDVIERRLARLSPECHRVLGVASVFGREFRFDLLGRVANVTEDTAIELLEEAVAAQVVSEMRSGFGQYRFAHALIRQTLYEGMTETRRVKLHARVGEALQDRVVQPDLMLGELAHHFYQASKSGDTLVAVEYARLAGRQAAEQFAYSEAVDHIERALELAGEAERPLRCELLCDLGAYRWRAVDYIGSRQANFEAAMLANTLGMVPELLAASLAYGGSMGFGGGLYDPRRRELLELSMAQLAPDSEFRALVIAHMAACLTFTDQFDERRELTETAIDLARQVGDPTVLAQVLTTTCTCFMSPDNLAASEDRLTEAIELAAALGAKLTEFEGRLARMTIFVQVGRFEAAQRDLDRCTELGTIVLDPHLNVFADVARMMLVAMRGDVKGAELLSATALEHSMPSHSTVTATTLFGTQLLAIRRLIGRPETLLGGTRAIADISTGIAAARSGLALLFSEMGQDEDAARQLAQIMPALTTGKHDLFWMNCVDHCARVASAIDDVEVAQILYDLLLPYEGLHVIAALAAAYYAPASQALGLLAETLERPEIAETHFARALREAEAVQALPCIAETKYLWGRMLVRRAVDPPRGRALVTEALDDAQTLQLDRLALKIANERNGLAGTPGKSPVKVRIRDVARFAVSTRGRSMMAKLVRGGSDADLEQRFGSGMARRALFGALARSFQPSMSCGFEGDIVFRLRPDHAAGDDEIDAWTLHIDGDSAAAHPGGSATPGATLTTTTADLVRFISGEVHALNAWGEGRVIIEGDLLLAARLTEMFGGSRPFELLAENTDASRAAQIGA
jgi:class 3 adenylate cyclase/tetratricopeptide (TPR) repeat protein